MLTLLGLGLLIAASYFAITWAISLKIRNYGLLDVAWSYGVAILAPIYALAGPGLTSRKWLLTAIGAAWSLRLGTYILIRVIQHHPTEDARYATLRKKWPGSGMFLVFFELQAVLVVIFSLPFLLAAFNPAPQLAPLELAGLILAVFSLALPVLAVVNSMPSGLISAAIIAFGMQQAWRMTTAAEIQLTGPFRVGGGESSPA